ncbi:sigma-54-dependent transcriptional regulator [Pseudahrensia aquimaris]|uniref:DNA-binding transcriptional regulator NtrC n=1 Tax=Pseudahrensia aquimaris TaxID=744461 RepID=A0ABW3F9L2_9HYPH
MSATILVVDDDPVQRRLLEGVLNKLGHRVVLAEDGELALAVLRGQQGTSIDCVVLDLIMPGLDGMGVLAQMHVDRLAQPVIVQTAQGSIDTAVAAMRAGASDFVVKPAAPERLRVSIQNALKMGAMEQVVKKVQKTTAGTFTFDDMIAESPAMEKVVRLGQRAAASNIPILIEGESGVGKEVIAKAIQGSSERAGKPFVTVNCGALPENLAESILFGHEKGAFTGADKAHAGKFKEADGGTLFLDEVGELTLDLQVKLLRAIQEGEIDPVGGKRPVKVDIRLISATNRDMIEQVKSGAFREDLYYRLNVFPIAIPPLRARKSDIAALVRHFTAQICLEEGRRNISDIRTDALAMLETYDWPGNIRQLENAIFRAVVLCDGTELTIDEFPQIAAATGTEASIYPSAAVSLEGSGAEKHHDPNDGVAAGYGLLLDQSGSLRSIDDLEADIIRFAIEHHDGRMAQVARSLGIGRSTLYRKLKEYGLDGAETATDASDAA